VFMGTHPGPRRRRTWGPGPGLRGG
jgi:hypothetical protein